MSSDMIFSFRVVQVPRSDVYCLDFVHCTVAYRDDMWCVVVSRNIGSSVRCASGGNFFFGDCCSHQSQANQGYHENLLVSNLTTLCDIHLDHANSSTSFENDGSTTANRFQQQSKSMQLYLYRWANNNDDNKRGF